MNSTTPIISRFSCSYQEAIQTYCDNINNSCADLFVVMARKGVCFFDILKDDGLITLSDEQKIISSSALDFTKSISPETKVVVTDDIMISGTSIADVTNLLIDMGVPESNISIIVLATDSENMKLCFKTETKQDLIINCWSLSNADCIELSVQISNMLSLLGRPYDVDFPVYDEIIINKSTLNKLLHPNLWNVYNVTNSLQAEGKLEALTLIPTQENLEFLWSNLGFQTNPFAHIKYRLYVREIDPNNISIQLVPFILFFEISYEQIDELCLKLSLDVFADLSYSSKLRACQFVLCHFLAILFTKNISHDIRLSMKNGAITNLFGYDFANKIIQIIHDKENLESSYDFIYHIKKPDMLDYSNDESQSMLDIVQKNMPQDVSEDDRELNLQLLQPFVSWYLTRELPTRNELADGHYHFREDRDFIKKKTYRLDAGYSFLAIQSIFVDKKSIYRWPDTISVFLDRAIDMGVIVPITFDNSFNKTVCRAFRHGEDLPFGVADKSRVLYFLQQLQIEFSKRQCEGIARISLEKIIVLFIQMALREKGIFNQFLGFRNRELLSIRYSVHGAIATTIFPEANVSELKYYFDAASYWDWVTNFLSKEGIIVQQNSAQNNPNDYICAESFVEYEKQLNNICNDIQIKIKKYASLFAEWYGNMHHGQRNVFKNQVIQLSTCFSLPTAAMALATELHYFCRYWEEDVELAFNQYATLGDPSRIIKITGEDTAKVLNSGREKYEWFEKDFYVKAISDVKQILANKNSYMSADWEGRWHSIVSSKRPYNARLIIRFHECYCYLLVCYACYELLSCGEMAETNINKIGSEQLARIQEYKKEFKNIKQKHDLQIDDFNELFSFVTHGNFKIKDVPKRIAKLKMLMNRILPHVNAVVDDIQTFVSEQVMEAPIYYSTCIITEIQCNDVCKCSDIIEDAWISLPENENKTKVNIFKLTESSNEEYQRYGIFYENNNPQNVESSAFIKQLVSSIYHQAEINCLNSRFIILPELPPPCRLKYCYKSNMQSEFARFNQTVCERFIPHFQDKAASQILLVKNSYENTNSVLDEFSGFVCKSSNSLDPGELGWATLTDYTMIYFEYENKKFPRAKHDIPQNSIASLYINSDGANGSKPIGTATVFRYKDSFIAVTCRHCLSNDVDETYLLKLKMTGYHVLYGKRIALDFDLKYDDQDELPAEYEVAAIELYWDDACTKKAYFEQGVMLDLEADYSLLDSKEFICFGYPSIRGNTIRSNQYYEANDGYLEFLVEKDENFKPGFSGAMFINQNNIPVAIAYSYQDCGKTHAYGIPMNLAANRAKEILNERDEQK